MFLMGLIYDQSTLVTRNDEDHQIGVTTRLNQTKHPQPSVPTLWITATPIRRISV